VLLASQLMRQLHVLGHEQLSGCSQNAEGWDCTAACALSVGAWDLHGHMLLYMGVEARSFAAQLTCGTITPTFAPLQLIAASRTPLVRHTAQGIRCCRLVPFAECCCRCWQPGPHQWGCRVPSATGRQQRCVCQPRVSAGGCASSN
jgi:hypothetical protein